MDHLHLVREDAKHRALPRLVGLHDFQQLFVRLFQVLNLDEISLHQSGAQQPVGAHRKLAVFRKHIAALNKGQPRG